jgi:predicted kinase
MSHVFHLLVGIVGSGKSTVAKRLVAEHGATLVSSDDIRLEVCGDMTDQSKNGYIFGTVIPDRIKAAVAIGDVVYDATNYSRKSRKDVCLLARSLGCKVVAHVLQTPFEECYRRNKARVERVVPEFVLDRMVSGYEEPDVNIEKIDEVRKVNS